MDEHQLAWNEKVARNIIKHLEKRRMAGSYTDNAERARDEVLEMIPSVATIFRCGSMTALGMGLWEALEARPDVTVLDPYKPELPPEEAMELRRQEWTHGIGEFRTHLRDGGHITAFSAL